eukprot:9332943-Heterocapsa_arctica.AAC.1
MPRRRSSPPVRRLHYCGKPGPSPALPSRRISTPLWLLPSLPSGPMAWWVGSSSRVFPSACSWRRGATPDSSPLLHLRVRCSRSD